MKKLIIILLILPIIAQAQNRPDLTYKVLEVTYIGLNTADYIITLNGLKKGGKELNPIAHKMSPVGMAGLKLTSTASVLLLSRVIYKRNPKAAKITMFAMNIATGLVVSNNIKVVINLN